MAELNSDEDDSECQPGVSNLDNQIIIMDNEYSTNQDNQIDTEKNNTHVLSDIQHILSVVLDRVFAVVDEKQSGDSKQGEEKGQKQRKRKNRRNECANLIDSLSKNEKVPEGKRRITTL